MVEPGSGAKPKLEDQPQAKADDGDHFGMLILADEIQDNPDGSKPHPFDVVAVHGLYGGREDTWTTAATDDMPGSNWLKDQIHKHHPASRILTFGYDASNTRAGIATMAGISAKAFQLLDVLVELRKASDPDIFRPLVFIAHDLGGIIVKEALYTATLEYSKYRTIKDLTRLLIFFGCPHRCTSTQDMEDKVAKIFFANKNPRLVGVTRSIKELARSIIEINGSFAVSNMPSLLSIVNVYSEEEDTALQIFDNYTATLDVAFEERIGCPKPHEDMCKVAQFDDFYKRIDQALSRDDSPLRPNHESVEYLQTLCSLAAPVHPLESFYGPKHQLSWISRHESYTKWLDNYGPSMLHVHGTTGASDASEYIFQCLDVYRGAEQGDQILIYFSFNRHDDRCNSVVAMLNTLLAQILNQNQDFYYMFRNQYEQMSFHRSWTQAELWCLFQNLLSAWEHSGILCVINGLNECDDSRTAFLQDLCSFVSRNERSCKIVFTSTTDSDLQAALADWPTIDLDDRPEDHDSVKTDLVSDIEIEVLELMQQCPALRGFDKIITEKLFECRQDKHLRRLVLNQLRLGKNPLTTKSTTQWELELLPPTTSKEMFARILAGVPSDRRVWARKVLSWVLYASHPLSFGELGVALALEVDNLSDETVVLDELVYHHVIADLDEVFGGMFIGKHNEVHFGHPDARKFLLAADGEQECVWYDVKETAHQEITDVCIFYLSLQQVQDSMAMSCNNYPTDPLRSPTFVRRYILRDYAIKYWPRHYKLIPEAFRPTERVLEFVRDTKAMRCWAEAYWNFSNLISRTDRAFLSLLPVFAGLGLQDLVTEWLELNAETLEASQDRALALAEAARNAHAEVVRTLLLYGGYNQTSLQDALVAGASCCDVAVLDELVTYAAESIENYKWPPVILCRAAQFGLENVVRKLLDSGASLDTPLTFRDTTPLTFRDMTPLHFAVRQGHEGVVKVLLDHKASLTMSTTFGDFPLHLASWHGDATVVKLLLDAGAEVNILDADKTNAICIACSMGNYKAVGILAEAGCDVTCDEQGDWQPLVFVASRGFIKSAQFLLEKKANTEVEGRRNWTPLRLAAFAGHADICRLLLENGANANTLSGGAPILVESARQGNLEVVQLLVGNGAAVNAVNSEGWTALQNASIEGHISVVTFLLDHGADINHTNERGDTSIFLAAQSSCAELVQLLIDRGADLHRATTVGWTPIHFSYDHAETTRVLMENHADANRIAKGNTPLHLAASNNQVEVVKVLLSFKPDLEIQYTGDGYDTGYTALSIAALNGYADVVRLLLEAGANVNHKSDRNHFPLQFAVSCNKEDVVRTLMEYHPNLDLVDDDGDTALSCIQLSGSLAIAKLLVNGGSDLETRNNQGNTPLCNAVMSAELGIVKYLIDKKAELNIIGGKHGGPLHIACRQSNFELVRILVAAGADKNLVDPTAGTPMQSACCSPDPGDKNEMQESIIRYLINELHVNVTTVGGEHGCALNAACGWSTPEMVKLILEKGAMIDVKDGMGKVAIHFAAMQGLEHFQKILDAGADVEVRDKMGRTVLHWATIGGVIDVVERVISLSRGLIDQADVEGWTPLLWAARGCGTDHEPATSNVLEEIIKLLLERGADPCVKGKGLDREWSPVKVARYHGVDDAVVQLLMAKAKEKLAAEGEEDTWDESFHTSGKALKQDQYCDSCFCSVYGVCYHCETCLDFDLCYKCYLSRHLMHPDHLFKAIGPEYEPVIEKAPAQDESDENDDNGDDDDTEDDDTDDVDTDDVDTDDDDGSKHETKQGD